MADDIYASVAGFIQFDVESREYNDGEIRDATIRSLASGNLLRISFFPDFAEVDLEKGDFIAVDGKITERDVEQDDGSVRTYTNMTAKVLFKGEVFRQAPAKVVKKESGAKASGRKTF